MKKLDKLKVKLDKRLLIFLLILMIVGIISGSVLVCIINNSDKLIIKDYLSKFINDISTNSINYTLALKSNLFNYLGYIIVIWLLGMSVIGLPITLTMYFIKSFILGFSIGSIIFSYGFKGILFALIYIFPSQIIYIIVLTILMIYSISFSLRLIETLFKKKTTNFRIVMNKYLVILVIAIICGILTTLYDTYLMPFLINKLILSILI